MQLEVPTDDLRITRSEDRTDLVRRHAVRPERVLGPADHLPPVQLPMFGPGGQVQRRRPRRRGLHRVGSSLVELVVRVHRRAGLEQRLEVAEHPAPAAAGAHVLQAAGQQQRELRRALELVGHGELADAALALGDLVREAGEPLGRPSRRP